MSIIGIVGGTGKLGAALAGRWAAAGHDVIVGSRDAANAVQVAAELAERFGKPVRGMTNRDAAAAADIVVLTVPFAAQADRIAEIRDVVGGKIVVDTTVPLVPPKVMRVQMPPEGSAALRAQGLLGPDARLVSGFHSVAAHKLATDADIACDVLVFSDDKAARGIVVELANDARLRGLHAGALANSIAAEAMTSILIFLNKTYKVDGAGLVITGELIEPEGEGA